MARRLPACWQERGAGAFGSNDSTLTPARHGSGLALSSWRVRPESGTPSGAGNEARCLMTANGNLDVIDSTVQQTYEWLNAIGKDLAWSDRRRQFLALRSVLHALRDYLVVDESAQLA